MMTMEEFKASFVSFTKHLEKADLSDSQQLRRLIQLYRHTLTYITDQSRVQFTSLFSRLSYVLNSFDISGKDAFLLHAFRRYDPAEDADHKSKYIEIGKQCVNILGKKILHIEPVFPYNTTSVFERYFKNIDTGVARFIPFLSVMVKEILLDQGRIVVQSSEEPFEVLVVSINRPDRNEDFFLQFKELVELEHIMINMHLIDVEVDNEGLYHPSAFVLEPDFLFDVTAVSECFSSRVPHQLGYILRRFISSGSSAPLIIGNIANYFLDQLIYKEDLEFEDIRSEIFQLDPLSLSTLDDAEVRKMVQLLKRHFYNLKRVIQKDFVSEGIAKNKAYIEPAFYSAKYGLQGRLDLFVKDETQASIVELKSGSPFMVNQYGLSNNHYHQTLLYDMLISSVYGNRLSRKNFILYSKELGNNLRYAPGLKTQQRETIKVRNQLYLTDLWLQNGQSLIAYLLQFQKKYDSHIKGYQKEDLNSLIKTLSKLSDTERAYCDQLKAFVIKEHRLSKLGDDSKERLSGLASLWKDTLETKIEQFNIINHLEIVHNFSSSADPIIYFKKTDKTAELSNFRIGDLAVLYRDQNKKDSILKDQVFKCIILANERDNVHVRLRCRQEDASLFSSEYYWNLEHDNLDNGFHAMTRSIIEFASSAPEYRSLIMGLMSPRAPGNVQVEVVDEMTEEQNVINSKIINSKDYFLLWGPPGTGKTSVLLKHLVRQYYSDSKSRILLLSYTNRAVDEICHTLLSIDNPPEFIRIGSRYSTAEPFQQYLLDHQLSTICSRSDLIDHLSSCRIFVGTVASILGKTALFDLLSFDYAIVDEASQILDTSLIGLLSRVGHFVLVGDHRQLPAVVLQDYDKTVVQDEQLRSAGIKNLSNSLFERLYLNAVSKGWTHAYGQLSHQGRMHQQLMDFPNRHFYDNSLSLLPGLKRLSGPMEWAYTDDVSRVLGSERMIYVPTDIDIVSDNIKVNEHEAHTVIILLKSLMQMYAANGVEITDQSIGVITPYRAQIARIIKNIELADIEQSDKITVDTVERYQGGARDVIILSATVNFLFQMSSLVSESDMGIDRKLNVAFTRAREQFILIGNEEILRKNAVYADLIDRSYRLLIAT